MIKSWLLYALAATLLAGLRGYWARRTALHVGRPQHVQLVSCAVTLTIAALIILRRMPHTPDLSSLLLLSTLGGIAYAIYSSSGSYAQQLIDLSTYNSIIPLGGFLPVLFFYAVLRESLSVEEWSGVIGALCPMLLIGVVTGKSIEARNRRKGYIATGAAVLALTAVHIANKLSSVGRYETDPFILMFGTNVIVAVTLGVMIPLFRDRARIDLTLVASGSVSGVLNVASYGCLLFALRADQGGEHASQIVPLYAQNLLISTAISEAYDTKRVGAGAILIGMWVVGAAWLMWTSA